MKKLLLVAILAWIGSPSFAQVPNYWTPKNSNEVSTQTLSGSRVPVSAKLFNLDLAGFKTHISKAPSRENTTGRADIIVAFPNAAGIMERFSLVEASILHPDLAAKYPGIQSYAGQGIDDPAATIRFSVSQLGLHGMVLSAEKSTYFIDPYTIDKKTYAVYVRPHLRDGTQAFKCLTLQADNELSQSQASPTGRTNDKKLRRYRLALSCNAEYGNLFAGAGTDAQKKANILAQMNVTMTRVNGVYERDLAITMQIVPNNTAIIYYGSTSTDPWSSEFNTKTQQVIDAAIGNANYDIGHNFNTSGGGNAGCIGCVCKTGSKGSGYTGRADPTGDAFDIDYVAHEMGHQFGGYHTMNTCSRSGSGTTEVEPASGSSIMGYAGICPTNIQANSDDYFHYVNIRDISANVQTGVSSACAQIVAITNNPPTANAGLDYTIPKSTAFVLKGQGSDPDGDVLTYTWEENDPEQAPGAGSPVATWTKGPMFRSRKGTTSPDRYMPQLSDVIAGNLAPTWEVIPSVARTLKFALTVRDNKAGGGQTSDDLMTVTVNGTAGPFVVTAPNTNVTWSVGQAQTVTWNVASTNVAPVSAANVNILLSTNGGLTYPVTLVANTPNDGSQAITVPNNVSTTCRVKVEAAANIFYDISNVNFVISGAVACTATVPTGLAASNVTTNGATLTWNAVAGATYDLQYRQTGAATWTTLAVSGTSTILSGLTAATSYEAQVRSKCTSTTSAYSPSVTFTTTNTPSCTNVTLTLKLDNYPEETSWTIKNSAGTTVASGGTYGSSPDGSTITSTKCLAIGCYTFTINDSYGDGICCSYGNGSYTLKNALGTVLASGATFTSSEVKNFCLGSARARLEDEAIVGRQAIEKSIYPNPVEEYLHVNVLGDVVKSFKVYAANGIEIKHLKMDKDGVDVSQLHTGIYFISIETSKEVSVKKFIKK
ncbi:MAG: zinc-dependent metalloprotease family protein [Bacteroidota bacterium]